MNTYESAIATLPENFYSKLLQSLPCVTRMEVRVCALTSLNYSAKEIGQMLGVGKSTVDNHRYRIKRKLGLTQSESLHLFLLSLNKEIESSVPLNGAAIYDRSPLEQRSQRSSVEIPLSRQWSFTLACTTTN